MKGRLMLRFMSGEPFLSSVFMPVSVFLHQGGDGTASCEVRAHLAMLNGDFKLAEMHYLEQVGVPSFYCSQTNPERFTSC